MKKIKRIGAVVLALIMTLSLALTAFADNEADQEASAGTITLEGATIGQSYHIYKLFDVTYGNAYTGDEGNEVIPTAYVATEAQKEALEKADGNVFAFTGLSDGTYQVTVAEHEVNGTFVEYTDEEIIAFINSFMSTLGSGVYSCNFPGAKEETGENNEGIGSDKKATASTIEWNKVPNGYYFVTSSLGSVVTITTSNPDAAIVDKNSDNPDWDNEPEPEEPDEPVKDVQKDGQSIDGAQVKVGEKLTYVISYTNNSGTVIDELTITDASPEGTVYDETDGKCGQRVKVLDAAGDEIDLEDGESTLLGVDNNGNTRYLSAEYAHETIEGIESDKSYEAFTWMVKNLPDGCTVEVSFDVVVTEAALKIDTKTIENGADVEVKIGENTYDLKTNIVENPVYDPDDPVKDVLDIETGKSIDGKKVDVGKILRYEIEYTNRDDGEDAGMLDSVVITDAPPTGTVYVVDSARGERTGVIDGVTVGDDGKNVYEGVKIEVAPDGTITWKFEDVAVGETVTVYFDVEVTEAALTITNKTVVNDADVDVTIGENECNLKTNVVKNPLDEIPPEEPNPGKVIINPDGSKSTVSTGAFGETVTFDVSVNAVNKVKQDVIGDDGDTVTKNVQVEKYYIYDRLDPGFTLQGDTMKVSINGVKYDVDEDESQGNKATTYTIKDADGNAIGTLFTYIENDSKDPYTLIAATIYWVDEEGAALYPDCKIDLIYNAVINENAEIAGNGNLNSVRYDYKTTLDEEPTEPDPKNPEYPDGEDLNHESEEKTTVTYTYALGLQKTSTETGEPLEGAEFAVTDAGGNQIYAVKATDGEYNYTADKEEEDAVSSFVSNKNGQIIIKGVDIGSYTFKETKAPKGYNLLTEPVSVEARMDSTTTKYSQTEWTVTRYFEAITKEEFNSYTGDMYIKTTKTDEDGNSISIFTKVKANERPDNWSEETFYYKLVDSASSESTVEEESTSITFPVNVVLLRVFNSAGSELPGTGGMGTTIFYILGAILVLGAGILLVVKRRMRAESNS